MKIEKYNGINVLRDDLLLGGTKSIFVERLLDPSSTHYVYASPVYGGFQIALSAVCKRLNKKAVIFCAKRKDLHYNTIRCKDLGADVYQVKCGYMSVVTSKAKEYCRQVQSATLLPFGADSPIAIEEIAKRCQGVINQLGFEPDVIACAVGSGTLVKGILQGSMNCKVIGVQVGKKLEFSNPRLALLEYPKAFEKLSGAIAPFPSSPNYDLKAWEMITKLKLAGKVLFWNVM